MHQLTVGQFKSKFSEVLAKVLAGEVVGITYGKSKKKVAALVPYNKIEKHNTIRLGVLKGKGSCTIKSGFKISDEEFLQS